jgi:exonuclease III
MWLVIKIIIGFGRKKGYSGVALFCKNEPDHVEYGFRNEEYDKEGRIIRADYGDTSTNKCLYPIWVKWRTKAGL